MTQTLEPIAKACRGRERIWTEQEYLDLPGGKLVEFDNGHVEVLPMPSEYHQDVVINLLSALRAFVRSKNLGKVLCAPMPVKVDLLKYREPDLLFKRRQKLSGDPQGTKFWDGADLVVEVVSEGTENRRRDLVVKRRAYAAAKISEYWLVDLQKSQVTVLKLRGGKYVVYGTFRGDDRVRSALFPEFVLSVTEIFQSSV